MGAVERAEQDLQRGDHWLARQRLRGYLSTRGYEPELLARIGAIALEMHDAFDAGRMWLTSSAHGDEVERAIIAFVTHAGKQPRDIVAQLPKVVRLLDFDRYPPVARDRLKRLDLADAIRRTPQRTTSHTPMGRWATLFLSLAGIGLLLFCVTSCVLGAGRILSWTFGSE